MITYTIFAICSPVQIQHFVFLLNFLKTLTGLGKYHIYPIGIYLHFHTLKLLAKMI